MNNQEGLDTERFTLEMFFIDLRKAFHFSDFPEKELTDKAYCIATWGFTLGLGLNLWPYEFFVTLRVVICCVTLYYLYLLRLRETEKQPKYLLWGLVALAVLYNPIFVVHFGSKLIWVILNIATLVFLFRCKQVILEKHVYT